MAPSAGPAAELESTASPFLRRHASDRVPWSEWDRRPASHGRPTFLSIGFAACHLCEIMRVESFEDAEVGGLMARHFVNVLVDREERPDVDAIYVAALEALTGGAGYPANLFLLPSGEPFYGTAYLPRGDFLRLLRAVLDFLERRRSQAEVQAGAVRSRVAYFPRAGAGAGDPELVTRDAARTLLAEHDGERGGFGTAPKFPAPCALDFLIRHGLRRGEGTALGAAQASLDAMARGAVHDFVGGGFHRYAVDREWRVPHFEKVLADNLSLAATYLRAATVAGRPEYAVVAERTLDFVLRDLRTADDLLATAIDASVEGVAGGSYRWTWCELRAALGADAGTAAELFGLSRHDPEPQLLRPAWPDGVCGRVADELRLRLLQGRTARPQPARIDTAVVGDAGLACGVLAEAAGALRRPDFLAIAGRLADRVLAARGPLPHLLAGGDVARPAFLPDYAGMVDGLLALYQASGDGQRLEQSLALASEAIELFADPDNGGFLLAQRGSGLIAPSKPFADRPAPSPNSLLALALVRLAALTGDERYEQYAVRTLDLAPVALLSVPSPALVGHTLFALEIRLARPAVLALIGRPADGAVRRLARAANEHVDPTLTLAYCDPTWRGQVAVPAEAYELAPAALLCDGRACWAPERDPKKLRASLRVRTKEDRDGPPSA